MYIASGFMGAFSEHLAEPMIVSQVSSHVVSDNANVVEAQQEHRLLHQQLKDLEVAVAQVPPSDPKVEPAPEADVGIDLSYDLPETTIISHAPGWTLFRNIYMSHGTLFVVSSQPRDAFPEIRLITSTGLPAENTPENIAARMPTEKDMDFLTPVQARQRWGPRHAVNRKGQMEKNRVWNVEGTTFLINEPKQFLDHYYHFCAEWLLGAWAFWLGAHNFHIDDPRTIAVKDAPPVARAIFAHTDAGGWRDRPGFNSYVFRAAFPSITIEVEQDWKDRIDATAAAQADGEGERAWHFETLLLTDRSASFRGESCGMRNQRIASESLEYMQRIGNLTKFWWEPIRREVLRFAGVDQETLDIGMPKSKPKLGSLEAIPQDNEDIVVTYISRQGARRHLIDEDHDALVEALTDMCMRKGWELNVVQAERLTKDQQLQLAARTTVSTSRLSDQNTNVPTYFRKH